MFFIRAVNVAVVVAVGGVNIKVHVVEEVGPGEDEDEEEGAYQRQHAECNDKISSNVRSHFFYFAQ